ncbi:MAG: HPr family phosphocarrier protein [Pseudomonadota bacterium]
MSDVSCWVRVVNKKGLHARASGKFARLAGTFQSDIRVTHDGESANGTFIMDLLMLGAHMGTEIQIAASGEDADIALAALTDLVEGGFGELAEDNDVPGAAS